MTKRLILLKSFSTLATNVPNSSIVFRYFVSVFKCLTKVWTSSVIRGRDLYRYYKSLIHRIPFEERRLWKCMLVFAKLGVSDDSTCKRNLYRKRKSYKHLRIYRSISKKGFWPLTLIPVIGQALVSTNELKDLTSKYQCWAALKVSEMKRR